MSEDMQQQQHNAGTSGSQVGPMRPAGTHEDLLMLQVR